MDLNLYNAGRPGVADVFVFPRKAALLDKRLILMDPAKLLMYSRTQSEYATMCIDHVQGELGCQMLDPQGDLVEQLKGVEMMIDIGGLSSREIIDAAVDAKFWQVIGTGLDHCDVQYILGKGIALGNTPGFTSAFGLAETAMMYILMFTRKYNQARENFFERTLYEPNGKTLADLTLGIVGFGASGRQLAKRAKSFGMRIEAIDIVPLEDDLPADMQPDFYGMSDQMEEVIARCDVLSLHLHLTPKTRHIMDASRLALMKPTAFLVNVARGALVDQDALAEALLEGKIGGAGIDVFSEEPADCTRPEYQLPNCIVTPHTSGQTDETVRRRCQIVIDNARRLAAGDQPLYTVDASMGLGKS